MNFEIENVGNGWLQIFKSAEMQAVVDQAGNRIASNAGPNFEYVQATNNRVTVAGFVVPVDVAGCYEEATDKTLTKAVGR